MPTFINTCWYYSKFEKPYPVGKANGLEATQSEEVFCIDENGYPRVSRHIVLDNGESFWDCCENIIWWSFKPSLYILELNMEKN